MENGSFVTKAGKTILFSLSFILSRREGGSGAGSLGTGTGKIVRLSDTRTSRIDGSAVLNYTVQLKPGSVFNALFYGESLDNMPLNAQNLQIGDVITVKGYEPERVQSGLANFNGGPTRKAIIPDEMVVHNRDFNEAPAEAQIEDQEHAHA